MKPALLLAFLGTLLASAAFADRLATTEDGRKVVLRDDGTWVFAGPAAESDLPPIVLLQVTEIEDGRRGCWIEMEATNVTEERLRGFEPSILFSGTAPAWKRDVSFRFPALVPQSSIRINRTIRDEKCSAIGDGRIIRIAGECRNGQEVLEAGDCLARVRVLPTNERFAISK